MKSRIGVEGGEKQNKQAKEWGQTAYKDTRSPTQAQNTSKLTSDLDLIT